MGGREVCAQAVDEILNLMFLCCALWMPFQSATPGHLQRSQSTTFKSPFSPPTWRSWDWNSDRRAPGQVQPSCQPTSAFDKFLHPQPRHMGYITHTPAEAVEPVTTSLEVWGPQTWFYHPPLLCLFSSLENKDRLPKLSWQLSGHEPSRSRR